jgi:hypothetical protein
VANTDSHRSHDLTDVHSGRSSLRHFPTFYLLWNYLKSVAHWYWSRLWSCLKSVATWFWSRRRAITKFAVNVTVLAPLVLLVLYGCWEYTIGPQRNAVEAISQAGGYVWYDWERSHKRRATAGSEPPWPKWFGLNLGPDFCGHVVGVGFFPDEKWTMP